MQSYLRILALFVINNSQYAHIFAKMGIDI